MREIPRDDERATGYEATIDRERAMIVEATNRRE